MELRGRRGKNPQSGFFRRQYCTMFRGGNVFQFDYNQKLPLPGRLFTAGEHFLTPP